MIEITYDPEADAAYIQLAKGTFAETIEHGQLICDVDADGKILGIEVLDALKTLPSSVLRSAQQIAASRIDAAE